MVGSVQDVYGVPRASTTFAWVSILFLVLFGAYWIFSIAAGSPLSSICQSVVGAQNAVYFNDGAGSTFGEVRFGGAENISYGVAVGDVNADGFPDIGVANSDGLNRIYLNRPVRNR